MASSPSAKSQKPLSHSKTVTRRSSINPPQFTQSPPTIASDTATAFPKSSPTPSHRPSASNVSTKFGGVSSGGAGAGSGSGNGHGVSATGHGASGTGHGVSGTGHSGGGGGGGGGNSSISGAGGGGGGSGVGVGIGSGGAGGGFRANKGLAKIIQIVFAVIGILLFSGLWIYMMAQVNCHTALSSAAQPTIEAFAIGGSICCLFVLCHSCLDHKLSIGRGVFGCIIFFLIAIVTFGNILVGFLAVNCLCMCYPTSNAFKENQLEDLVIFFLSISGSFCLIIILLVASVAL